MINLDGVSARTSGDRLRRGKRLEIYDAFEDLFGGWQPDRMRAELLQIAERTLFGGHVRFHVAERISNRF